MKMNSKKLDLKKYLRNFREINVGNEIPLLGYTPDYKIPEDLKFEEYEATLRNHDKKIMIKRYRLVGIVKNLKRPINAKKIYRGTINRRGLSYKIEEGKVFVILKRIEDADGMYVYSLRKDHPLIFEIGDNFTIFLERPALSTASITESISL